MGHKPDRKARKRRSARQAKRTFADELRANSRRVPQERRQADRKERAAFIKDAYETCRKAALARSHGGSVRTVDVPIEPSPSMSDAEYEDIARRLRKDDLKVSFTRTRVKSNMETWDSGAVFTLRW